jgi:hypothetical protein
MNWYEYTERTMAHDDVRCIKATDKAILCVIAGEDCWVPQSQVHEDSEVFEDGNEGTLIVTAWLAKTKGWV